MSTSITREEWSTLTMVPEENWGYRWGNKNGERFSRLSLGTCDVEPSHGSGTIYMQTPDHRAIVLCERCLREVRQVQS